MFVLQAPFFDRDRQVSSAKRLAKSALASLKAGLAKTAESVQSLLGSLNGAESARFASELEVLKHRAEFFDCLFQSEVKGQVSAVTQVSFHITTLQVLRVVGCVFASSQSDYVLTSSQSARFTLRAGGRFLCSLLPG